ncbi:MAG: 50S ribosomal protein L10 [Pirellulaceae bacterium]
MSKFVKNLMTGEVAKRLEGVDDALLVNVIGLDANSSTALRRELRNKGIELMVVKNSLARRATKGSSLEAAFDPIAGPLALVWGGGDFISLTKGIVQIKKAETYKTFEPRGGVMDGEHLTAERVHEISKWPNRDGMLSILAGQILAPGSELVSQLESVGAALASQIEKIADGEAGGTSEAGGDAD